MKAEGWDRAPGVLGSFISHMVQMKVRNSWWRGVWVRLYIPHGSDERALSRTGYKTSEFLYIPHGSDERARSSSSHPFDRWTLYPTWFRWKHAFVLVTASARWTLYPTWFRWKLKEPFVTVKVLWAFISHMVQMKAFLSVLLISL